VTQPIGGLQPVLRRFVVSDHWRRYADLAIRRQVRRLLPFCLISALLVIGNFVRSGAGYLVLTIVLSALGALPFLVAIALQSRTREGLTESDVGRVAAMARALPPRGAGRYVLAILASAIAAAYVLWISPGFGAAVVAVLMWMALLVLIVPSLLWRRLFRPDVLDQGPLLTLARRLSSRGLA